MSGSLNSSANSSRNGSASSSWEHNQPNGNGTTNGLFHSGSGDKVLLHPGSDFPSDAETLALELSNGLGRSPSRGEADAATDAHETAYSSVNSSVFVLAATTLGAGILALPYAMATLGALFGSLLLVCIGLASSYSIRLLLTSAATVGATTYEELGHALFPRFGRRLVVACTLVLIFGSLTAFFVIIADTLGPAVNNIVGGSDHSGAAAFFLNKKVLLVIAAIVVVYPLCLLRSIHALERWSFLAVGIILAFSVVVIIESGRALHNGTAAPNKDGSEHSVSKNVVLFNAAIEMFEAIPIICLAFTCQTMVFPIWNALQGGTERAPNQRETGLAPARSMWSVVNRSLVLCGTLYLLVGLFGYVLFGTKTHDEGDVLNNFPNKPFWDAVRLLFTLAICIHYPVVHFGFRGAVLHTWYGGFTDAENSRRFHALTVVTVFASLVLALVLPDLSTVFSLTGALCAFPYCFMFPTLFYLRLHDPHALVLYLRGPRANGIPQSAAGTNMEEAGTGSGDGAHPGDEERGSVSSSSSAANHGSFGTYQPLHNDNDTEDGSSDSTAAAVVLSPKTAAVTQARVVGLAAHTPVKPSSLSARTRLLFRLPTLTLPRRKQIPAYALLATASLLWVISIVVCFIDMVKTFQKDV